MSDRDPLVATPSQTVGPFFHIGLTRPIGGLGGMPEAGPTGGRIALRVLDGDGAPLEDALVEFWRADGTCGRAATGPDGACEIGFRGQGSGHINLCLFARGLLRHVYTRIYFDRDPSLASDPVLALVPEARRQTLVARADGAIPGRWRFDVHLQGPQETVFFDQ